MKYINTDRLIAEIERRKKEGREFAQKRGISSLGNAAQIRANEDEEILSLIISLQQEQPEVDLVEEITRFFTKNPIPHEHLTDWPLLKNTALYFYNIGRYSRDIKPEVDLEKEIDSERAKCNPIDEGMGVEVANIHIEAFDIIARHFYKLGLNSRKEE